MLSRLRSALQSSGTALSAVVPKSPSVSPLAWLMLRNAPSKDAVIPGMPTSSAEPMSAVTAILALTRCSSRFLLSRSVCRAMVRLAAESRPSSSFSSIGLAR